MSGGGVGKQKQKCMFICQWRRNDAPMRMCVYVCICLCVNVCVLCTNLKGPKRKSGEERGNAGAVFISSSHTYQAKTKKERERGEMREGGLCLSCCACVYVRVCTRAHTQTE